MPPCKVYHSILQIGLLQITIDPLVSRCDQCKHRVQRRCVLIVQDCVVGNCKDAVFCFPYINFQRIRIRLQGMANEFK